MKKNYAPSVVFKKILYTFTYTFLKVVFNLKFQGILLDDIWAAKLRHACKCQ